MTINVTADDFELLTANSASWASSAGSWAEQHGRFEPAPGTSSRPFDPSWHPSWDWAMAYWLDGTAWVAAMLARSFLDARGEAYEIVRDTADGGGDHYAGSWVILTNYRTPGWVLHDLEMDPGK